ncbi:DMT family transporter [Vibrio sp. S4M6]|uniref:DMT family transporter n=1 Tax=Vibrio sinus TaxID=2946865 RepID=UPI00202A6CBA|nr:DMT family transporter [Vibrio sinus]MCL9781902.1 DMT family transporter [Vibrio sinus]
MLRRLSPMLFVLLWSTGFVGAKYGLPYAPPATFLSLRVLINLVIFMFLISLFGRGLTTRSQKLKSIWVGMLVHGLYLGGVYYAIWYGFPAGLAALIVGLQPILTAVIQSVLYKKTLNKLQYLGLYLGLFGVYLVLQGNISFTGNIHWGAGLAFIIAALLGITCGTLYQKKHCSEFDLISATTWQYLGALIVFAPASFLFENQTITWNPTFVLTMAWLVIMVSVVAVLLLLYLIRCGDTEKVTSLFYLVPVVTALEAHLLFGEPFSLTAVVGFVVTAIGVYIVNKGIALPSVILKLRKSQ